MGFVRRVSAAALVFVGLLSAAGQSRADATVTVPEAGSRLRLTTDPDTPTELCIRIERDERTRTIELSLKPMTAANTIEVAPRATPAAPYQGDESAARSTLPSPVRDSWASRISGSTYALSASTLSFLVTGVALGVRGRRELSHLQERCGELPCGHGDATLGRRLYVAADVMLGLSAGFALATLWSFFVGDRESDPRSFHTVHSGAPRLSIAPQGGTLAWSASF